jgi:hypothetical protein
VTQVYFHCSNRKKVLVDRCGAVVDDLAEARDHADCVCDPSPWRVAPKIGAAGSYTSTMTSVKSSSLSPSLSCSASRIEFVMLAVQLDAQKSRSSAAA